MLYALGEIIIQEIYDVIEYFQSSQNYLESDQPKQRTQLLRLMDMLIYIKYII